MDKFPHRLKMARLGRNMTQPELAKKAYVSHARIICQYEKGRVVPGLDVAAQLAKALGVSLDWLAGIDDYFIDRFKWEEDPRV